MKKLILALVILLLAAPALAGTITVTTTTGFDGFLTRAMERANRETCRYYSQPVGCTQSQARKEFCRRAGFGGVTTCTNPADPATCTTTPLTATCDGANRVDVFPDTATFFQKESVRLVREAHATKLQSDVSAAEAAAKAGTQAQKDAYCVGIGLAAGCLD